MNNIMMTSSNLNIFALLVLREGDPSVNSLWNFVSAELFTVDQVVVTLWYHTSVHSDLSWQIPVRVLFKVWKSRWSRAISQRCDVDYHMLIIGSNYRFQPLAPKNGWLCQCTMGKDYCNKVSSPIYFHYWVNGISELIDLRRWWCGWSYADRCMGRPQEPRRNRPWAPFTDWDWLGLGHGWIITSIVFYGT